MATRKYTRWMHWTVRLDGQRDKRSDSECWPWTGAKDNHGYGNIRIDGLMVKAHRAAFVQAFGEVPAGLVIRHNCDNPGCCNPSHLKPGTQLENVQDRVSRGRSATLANGLWKLSARQNSASL